MKSLFFFIGTEAELIKVFPVCMALDKLGTPYQFIFSGQNPAANSKLLQYCHPAKDHIILNTQSSRVSALGLFTWFFQTLWLGVVNLRPVFRPLPAGSILVVHGDTVSTVMGALLGRFFGLTVAHLEAGLRSYNWFQPFPEEIDRMITSRLAKIHFAPNDWAVKNLSNVSGRVVNTNGNTLVDSLRQVLLDNPKNVLRSQIGKRKYFLFALHRQENLIDNTFISNMLELVVQTAEKQLCVFVMHEPTRAALQKLGLYDALSSNKNILISHRLPYSQFMKVVQESEFLLSDGGSNQEECFYFGLPFLILRNYTERIEGLGENAVLSKKDINVTREFLKNVDSYRRRAFKTGDSPSQTVAKELTNRLTQKAI